ncbi:MAG: 5'-methylthioadenosine/S-adenosylhomocysteine nucleosidase [Bacteroidales bacterium]|nr:5'-methylthioadenosine/S-adenosylhomocysteine nucleosidase [Bacteroidales bacterium]
MKVGLIVALDREYEALLRSGIPDVVRSGIGKVGAARTATEMILHDKPDCIVNSGCAGGLAPSVNVCDIVVGAQTAYHDVWCGEGNLRGQVQGLPQRFDADPALLAAASSLQTESPLHSGLICTGDQFISTGEEDAQIRSLYPDALACDMESAAIAQVCLHYGVPFLSFRIISDTRSGGDNRFSAYTDFWERIADGSFSFLRQLLEKL